MNRILIFLCLALSASLADGQNTDSLSYHSSRQLSDTSYSVKKPNGDSTVFIFQGTNSGGGDFSLPPLSAGSVLFSNGTTIAQDNDHLFWDAPNKRLGIGTNTPAYPLTVEGGPGTIFYLKSATGQKVVSFNNANSDANPVFQISASVGGYLSFSSFGLNYLQVFNINTGGKTRIGSSVAATSWLELPASTGAPGTAPVKIDPGKKLATSEKGAIENDSVSNHIYWTDKFANRYQLDQQSGTPAGLPALTSGSIVVSDGSTLSEDNSNLFWDKTLKRLGIGTNTPTSWLELPASTGASGTAPLKIDPGIKLSTSEKGAIENDSVSNHLYWTDKFANRYQLDQQSGTISGLPVFASGSIVVSDGSALSDDNSNLFWDKTLKRLGIGTNTPAAMLQVGNSTNNASISNAGVLTFKGTGGISITPNSMAFNAVGYPLAGIYFNGTTDPGIEFRDIDGSIKAKIGIETYESYIIQHTAIGMKTPTALLHLAAGSSTANSAPLKFTAGTNLTVPENGAIEFNGTHFYATIGTTRYQLDQQGGGVENDSIVSFSRNSGQDSLVILFQNGKRLAVKDSATDITDRLTPATLTDASTIIWDINSSKKINAEITLTSTGRTLSITNAHAGEVYILKIKQNGTGGGTITTWNNIKWMGGNTPTLTAAANAVDMATFYYDGTTFYGNIGLDYK